MKRTALNVHARLRVLFWISGLSALLVALAPLRLDAAAIPWRAGNIHYVAEGKPLYRVLSDILDTQGFPVTIQADLRSSVSGEFNGDAQSILKKLEAAYNFVPYYDGFSLEIVGPQDLKTAVLAIAPLSVESAIRALRQLDLIEPRFPIRSSAGTLRVSGPSRYINMLTLALDNERQQATDKRLEPDGGRPVMRVFRLKHANAQDVSYVISRQTYEVPGVASLLSRLVEGSQVEPDAGAVQPNDALAGKFGMGRAPPSGRSELQTSATLSAPVIKGRSAGRIQADTRTNSVVIHDFTDMMTTYQKLIQDLDQPQELVQIDVAVIDVSFDAVKRLGVNWGVRNGEVAIDLGAGLVAGTLGGATGSSIRARISLLEGEGKATVLARPKVLTLNNSEAVLGSQVSAYVKVAGERTAELIPIDAGMLMRVTPLIIREDSGAINVRMSVNVEDGNFREDIAADGIPQVNRNFITTQALVGDGESLLVGGYQFEKASNAVSGVPFFKDIPWIGFLFRNREVKSERTERLFLITPKLVDVANRRYGLDLPIGSGTVSPRAKAVIEKSLEELAPSVKNSPIKIIGG